MCGQGNSEIVERTSGIPAIVVAVAVVVLWVAAPSFAIWMTGSKDPNVLGVFGDSFGAINALFSGLAFTGLFYAILLQRKELALQRRELSETRQVLKSQKGEAEKQNATLAQQTFDNTFFQLLRLQNDILNAIDLRESASTGRVIAESRDCFRFFYKYLKDNFQAQLRGMPVNTNVEVLDRIDIIYKNFYKSHEKDVGHYFRSLYNLVKFVDRSSISQDQKRIYTNLIRAQLSSYEQLLLFYNCLSSLGYKKFKPLIERYSLLKTVNVQELLHGECDLELYASSAYE